jgi:16S rRNA (guanine527-N7)-methyltransferase
LGVSRETLEELCRQFGMPEAAAAQFRLMLEALAAEADPHTTVADPEAAVDAHLADSLTGLSVGGLSRARRIADIGSGVGFPGLALAVALPSTNVDLIESAGRKSAVASRLAQAAKVTNARALTARAEELGRLPASLGGGREAYEAVTARAVAALAVLVEYAAPLLQVGGVLVAWKGARDAAEEEGGRAAADRLQMAMRGVERVVPFPGAENRHLHVFEKVGPTPGGFPRRPGMARKRPLARP